VPLPPDRPDRHVRGHRPRATDAAHHRQRWGRQPAHRSARLTTTTTGRATMNFQAAREARRRGDLPSATELGIDAVLWNALAARVSKRTNGVALFSTRNN